MEVVNNPNDPMLSYNSISSFIFNPIAIIILLLLIAACFILTSGDNQPANPMYNGTTSGSSLSSTVLAIILVILIIVIVLNVLQYCFNINIMQFINDIYVPVPNIEVPNIELPNVNIEPILELNRKQVFNIPGNTYTYEDGKAICKAYTKLGIYT